MRITPALLLVGALLCAGCADGGPEEPEAEASPKPKRAVKPAPDAPQRDIAWLGRLRKWEVKFDRDTEQVSTSARAVLRGNRRSPAFRRALRPLVNCPRSLRAKVGEPRAPRYSASYEMLKRACEITRRWALDLRERDEPASLRKLRTERGRAEDLFGLAHGELESTLLVRTPLPARGGKIATSRIEPRLSRVVSTHVYKSASGANVEVRCWSPRHWRVVRKEWGTYIGTGDFEGFASGETQINLSPRVCSSLAVFVYDRARPKSGWSLGMTAATVGILSHEAQHLIDGLASEAETECRGMQSIRAVARLLGASESYASGLAETYWTYLYPRNAPEYRTRACHDGGPLDNRPGSDVWP